MTDRVKLWDPWVRLCHAVLVIAFFGNQFLTEEGEFWHRALGYAAATAVILRFIWGFVASGAAAWSDCWPTPARLRAHLRALVRREPYHRLGHSPLGALVMLTMMTLMALLGLSGFLMEEVDYFWGEDWLEELHEILANGLLGLVGLHVAAAIFESLQVRDNLPRSMITGWRKRLD